MFNNLNNGFEMKPFRDTVASYSDNDMMISSFDVLVHFRPVNGLCEFLFHCRYDWDKYGVAENYCSMETP